MRELAIIIVSYNSASWLTPCLESIYAHIGDVCLDVVVVDNGSADNTVDLVERDFPQVRVVRSQNRGFGAGNNAGLGIVTAPYVLFLNPDTEILAGTLSTLVELIEARPAVGLLGCRQVGPAGDLHPTIRRFPTATRYLFSALGSERLPFDASWLGERVRDPARYESEVSCDWTSGSFMLARRKAVMAAGGFDERYFLFSEEPDLCLRLRRTGWEVRHVPHMTILHHAGKASLDERLAAQDAYSRKQYLTKNLPPWRRRAALAAYALGHILRASYVPSRGALAEERRARARRVFRTLLGTVPPPFERVLSAEARD